MRGGYVNLKVCLFVSLRKPCSQTETGDTVIRHVRNWWRSLNFSFWVILTSDPKKAVARVITRKTTRMMLMVMRGRGRVVYWCGKPFVVRRPPICMPAPHHDHSRTYFLDYEAQGLKGSSDSSPLFVYGMCVAAKLETKSLCHQRTAAVLYMSQINSGATHIRQDGGRRAVSRVFFTYETIENPEKKKA